MSLSAKIGDSVMPKASQPHDMMGEGLCPTGPGVPARFHQPGTPDLGKHMV